MDIKDMKELIRAVSESDISNFEYENEKELIRMKKAVARPEMTAAAPPLPAVPAKQSSEKTQTQKNDDMSCHVVKSPLVGVFYSSASPDAEPFVKVGDKVSKGQVLGIIEAMKLMNDIESEFDGEIVEILVNNKDMVEYDQTLFRIK